MKTLSDAQVEALALMYVGGHLVIVNHRAGVNQVRRDVANALIRTGLAENACESVHELAITTTGKAAFDKATHAQHERVAARFFQKMRKL